jgi:peroxisomal 2,4-dienoyl-CoA reductase
VIDIDVLGSFNTVKACLPHLKASRGRIIFVSATLHYSGTPFQSHVSAAKAAIDALSQVLAVELGPFGITSNVIAPGPIGATEGMARLANSEQTEVVKRATPLQRFGEAYEIADATIYLLAETGSFVNGAVLVVDGGSWHKAGGTYEPYPEIVLGDEVVQGVKGMKSKL